MANVTPVTRDGAINLIRDLKGTVEESLSTLAHILLHDRFTSGVAQVRIDELEQEVAALTTQVQELEERNSEQASRLLMNSLGMKMSVNAAREAVSFMKVSRDLPTMEISRAGLGDALQRYHRIAVGARNRVKDGHTVLAEMLLNTLIEELEHGKNERAGYFKAPRGWGSTGDCD